MIWQKSQATLPLLEAQEFPGHGTSRGHRCGCESPPCSRQHGRSSRHHPVLYVVLHSQTKEFIYRINRYFLQEKANREPLLPPSQARKHTADAACHRQKDLFQRKSDFYFNGGVERKSLHSITFHQCIRFQLRKHVFDSKHLVYFDIPSHILYSTVIQQEKYMSELHFHILAETFPFLVQVFQLLYIFRRCGGVRATCKSS